MIDYTCTKGRAIVRCIAYRPFNRPMPEGSLKVVFQAIDNGEVVAEDPLFEDVATELELARELHLLRNEGWEIMANPAMLK